MISGDDIEAMIGAEYWTPEKFDGWQPIETAPKDGTDVLVGFANQNRPSVVVGWFDNWTEYDSMNIIKGTPTHWHPLPAPPKVNE
jgi:hypothetical protein